MEGPLTIAEGMEERTLPHMIQHEGSTNVAGTMDEILASLKPPKDTKPKTATGPSKFRGVEGKGIDAFAVYEYDDLVLINLVRAWGGSSYLTRIYYCDETDSALLGRLQDYYANLEGPRGLFYPKKPQHSPSDLHLATKED